MSEEVVTLPPPNFLILAFLAGSVFSTIMIFFITWISDRLKESDVRVRNRTDHNPISEMDTGQLLNELRELRNDDELSRAKKRARNATNHVRKPYRNEAKK